MDVLESRGGGCLKRGLEEEHLCARTAWRCRSVVL